MSRRLANRPRCRKCDRALAPVYGTALGPPPTVLGYGYGATSLFCSLTCGHAWAVDRLHKTGGAASPEFVLGLIARVQDLEVALSRFEWCLGMVERAERLGIAESIERAKLELQEHREWAVVLAKRNVVVSCEHDATTGEVGGCDACAVSHLGGE